MGIPGETVTHVAQRLLADCGGLRGLLRIDLAELARERGVGDARSVRLKAALELVRRLAVLAPDERPRIGSPKDVANLLGIELPDHLIIGQGRSVSLKRLGLGLPKATETT